MRKYIATGLLALVMVLSSCLCAFAIPSSTPGTANIENESIYRNNPYRGTTLNVYNWGEYISDGGEGSLDVKSRSTTRISIRTRTCTRSSRAAARTMTLSFRRTT